MIEILRPSSAALVGPRRSLSTSRVAVARNVPDAVARTFERAQQLDDAGGGIQSHPVAEPAVTIGIVGEDDREAAFADRRAAEPQPARSEPRHELDPVRHRLVGDQRALRGFVEASLALEGDRTREDSPVHLRQRHVHRDVPGGEPAGSSAPVLLVAAGEHHLEHRRARGVQWRIDRRLPRRGDREPRSVQHDTRLALDQQRLDDPGRDGILQARAVQRQAVDSVAAERLDQRPDGPDVVRLHQGAIEDERRDRPVVRPDAAQVVQAGVVQAGPENPRPRQLGRLQPVEPAAGQRCGIREKAPGIPGAAVQQEAPEPPVRLGVDRGMRGELRVGLIVARQQREGRTGARAGLDDLLDPVGPVGLPAEQTHDDEPRLDDDLLAVEIDRRVVGELHEVGETHGGKRLAECRARGRQRGELGVGGREHDDVAGGLTEVDGFAAVGDDTGLGPEKMHRSVECVGGCAE